MRGILFIYVCVNYSFFGPSQWFDEVTNKLERRQQIILLYDWLSRRFTSFLKHKLTYTRMHMCVTQKIARNIIRTISNTISIYFIYANKLMHTPALSTFSRPLSLFSIKSKISNIFPYIRNTTPQTEWENQRSYRNYVSKSIFESNLSLKILFFFSCN